MTLEGHSNIVWHAVVYADGQRALSASVDNTLKVWDLQSAKLLHSLKGHSDSVFYVVVYADGQRALSASIDGTLKVWDLQSAKLLHSLEGHSNSVYHAVVYADEQRALSTSADGTLKVWDLQSGRLLHSLKGHSNFVSHAVVHANGQRALSASRDGTLKVWDLQSAKLLHSLEGHSDWVYHAVVYADGQRALSTSEDSTLKVWDLQSGRLLHTLEGHSNSIYHAVVYADEQRALSASADGTLKVWDLQSAKLLHSLEGHSNTVYHAVVYADGQRALSASIDGTLKVWDLQSGRLLHTLEGHSNSVYHAAAYADEQRALSTSADGTLKVWDLAALESINPSTSSSHYINAKVVLVGDSGVGKTGLRVVLTGGKFHDPGSTHGRFVGTFSSEMVPQGAEITVHREALLWDLAGQPTYRIIHQLHLGEVAVALVVFDAKSTTDPLAGVRHWDKALRVARKFERTSTPPMKKYLVAARMDVGGPGVSPERLEKLRAELGFDAVFQTSAKQGWLIPELKEAIRKAIPWEEMPSIVQTTLFEKTKAFLLEMKMTGDLIEEEKRLFQRYCAGRTESATFEQFSTCVDRLCDAGLLRRLTFGGLVLLQPEVLDNYAAALVNAARQQPDGFGCISEDDALAGRFAIPKEARLTSPAQEKLLLISMVEDLVRNEIALREPGERGMMLIFPSQFTRENPALPEPEGKSTVFEFEGAVLSIYTTLAVRLSQSGTFTHRELWKNAIVFEPKAAAGTCGFFLQELEEGKGKLTLFHNHDAPAMARALFEAFVDKHLRTHALPETVRRRRLVACTDCKTPVSDIVLERALARGKARIACQVCDAEISLADSGSIPADEPTAREVLEMGHAADARRDESSASAIIRGKRETKDFDVFVSHRTADKPEVKAIAQALEARGILPWLDEWEIRPGERWQDALEAQITKIKSVAVFLGNEPLERYQKLELQGFIEQFVNRNCPVIPAFLASAKETPEMPPFLSGFHAVDFRKSDPDPMEQLIWGITGEKHSGKMSPRHRGF